MSDRGWVQLQFVRPRMGIASVGQSDGGCSFSLSDRGLAQLWFVRTRVGAASDCQNEDVCSFGFSDRGWVQLQIVRPRVGAASVCQTEGGCSFSLSDRGWVQLQCQSARAAHQHHDVTVKCRASVEDGCPSLRASASQSQCIRPGAAGALTTRPANDADKFHYGMKLSDSISDNVFQLEQDQTRRKESVS